MSQSFDAILFDLDGTLVDTAPDFAAVLNAMLTHRGLAALPYETVRKAVSQGARTVVGLGFGELGMDSPEFEAMRQEFLRNYRDHLADESGLFAGMQDVLEVLEEQGRPWGIVTNKPSHFTNPLLQALGLEQRCRVAICPDMVTRSKPDPEPMFKACAVLGLAPERVLYVGDHLRDIQAGKNASMPTAAAGWGYIPDNENIADWQADHNLASVQELQALLRLL
jgi:phosphoglycolate phosphatase